MASVTAATISGMGLVRSSGSAFSRCCARYWVLGSFNMDASRSGSRCSTGGCARRRLCLGALCCFWGRRQYWIGVVQSLHVLDQVQRLWARNYHPAKWSLPRRQIQHLVTGLDHQANRHRGRSGMGEGTYVDEPWVPDARFTTSGVFAEATDAALARAKELAAGS